MKNKKTYSFGTGRNGVVRHYIESPDETITESQIMMAKAREKAMNNGWGQGLDILGNMAVQYGTNMMTSGGGVPAGGKAGFGGNIQAGGGDGGKFGQGFGDWMGNNSNALASGISMLPMLAQMMGPGFAFGGKVPGIPVEVEGEEVGETPDGKLLDFKGPSHEDGGIGIDLPEGTEIFSKRIKVKGKTMAERKKAREKKAMTLEKLLEKSGDSDIVLKNSLKRTKANNAKEEESDKRLQEMVSTMKQLAAMSQGQQYRAAKSGDPNAVVKELQNEIVPQGKPQVAAYGGPIIDWNAILQGLNTQIPTMTGTSDDFHTGDPAIDYPTSKGATTVSKTSDIPTLATEPINGEAKTAKTGEGLKLPSLTFGDATGLAGTLYSAFAPMKNTEKNRAGDTPNINAFEDFGNDALDTVNEAKSYVASQRDKALKDLETSRTRITRNNRNTARGVNTLRALDLATDVNANKAQEDIYDTFSKQMMGLLSQEAGFENAQDQAVMTGEQNRDLADRQDRDNYYTQLAEDIATKGQGIQQVGKMLNQNKHNTVAEQAVNDSSINFQYTNGTLTDKAGNVVMTSGEIAKSAKALGMTPEEYINMINTQKNG